MKNRLNYQTSEYDCGPTTLINAIRYLFEREQITPELLKAISLYTLDAYNDNGEDGKNGTSQMAMKFIFSWLNQYGKSRHFPIYSEFLEGEQVYIGQNSPLIGCIQQQGVVVARVWHSGEGHYILLNDVVGDEVGIFDPYDTPQRYQTPEISTIEGQPEKMNHKVKMELMNRQEVTTYALGETSKREAMLIYCTTTRKVPDNSIEFII